MDKLESVQKIATKMINALESMTDEERLEELSLFNSEKRTVFQQRKYSYTEDSHQIFSVFIGDRTRGTGLDDLVMFLSALLFYNPIK